MDLHLPTLSTNLSIFMPIMFMLQCLQRPTRLRDIMFSGTLRWRTTLVHMTPHG